MQVGVVGDQGEGRHRRGTARFAEILDMARATEDAGLDSFWLADHFLFNEPGRPNIGGWEAFTFLSGLAACTSRIQLGPMVASTAFRTPALLARMASTLDEISGGRSIFALGAGCNDTEHEMFGYPTDHRVDRFEEALRIIIPLMREGHVDFEGAYYSVHDAFSRPRGPSGDQLPIWIAAWRPRMLRLAATYADAWTTNGHANGASVSSLYASFLVACRDVGRDPATVQLTAGTDMTLLGDNESGQPGESQITGTVEEVAEALGEFADAGITHLVCTIQPSDVTGVERLGAAVRLMRSTLPRRDPPSPG